MRPLNMSYNGLFFQSKIACSVQNYICVNIRQSMKLYFVDFLFPIKPTLYK